MLKAVVFDLDGTLLDTIPDIGESLNRALAANGQKTYPLREIEAFIGGGIRQAVVRALPKDADEALIQAVLALYGPDYKAHCTEDTRLYPGVTEMLEGLQKAGLKLGILSNKTDATTKKVAAHFFPTINFACVLGRIDGCPLKPDAQAAGRVMEAIPLEPGEIAYVGDSGTDMTFAHAAGFAAIASTWGYRSRQELMDCGAEAMPDTAQELLEELKSRI